MATEQHKAENTAGDYPPHIYPLPEGAVLLGLGGEFETVGKMFDGWAFAHHNCGWIGPMKLNGCADLLIYAAPADSEIARINGKTPQ